MLSKISPTVALVCRRFVNPITLRRNLKRRTWANVGACVGLLGAVAVNDADDFFDFLRRKIHVFKALSCSTVGTNHRGIVGSGKRRSAVIFTATNRTGSCWAFRIFHFSHPSHLNRMQVADASNGIQNHGSPERRF